GSLISFPTLISFGTPFIAANATNSVALWPGSLASAWGFRGEARGTLNFVALLTIPAIGGGLLGAWALLHTPELLFREIVPILILLATIILWLQPRIKRHMESQTRRLQQTWLAFLLQIPVSI